MSGHTPGPWQLIGSIPSEGFDCYYIKAQRRHRQSGGKIMIRQCAEVFVSWSIITGLILAMAEKLHQMGLI